MTFRLKFPVIENLSTVVLLIIGFSMSVISIICSRWRWVCHTFHPVQTCNSTKSYCCLLQYMHKKLPNRNRNECCCGDRRWACGDWRSIIGEWSSQRTQGDCHFVAVWSGNPFRKRVGTILMHNVCLACVHVSVCMCVCICACVSVFVIHYLSYCTVQCVNMWLMWHV